MRIPRILSTGKLGKILVLFAAAVGVLGLGTMGIVIAGLRDDLAPSDLALVLGSKVEPSGIPSPRLQARLDETVALYRAGLFTTVIVSGGFGKEGFDEAAVMKAHLIAHLIPADHIISDSHGDTSYASARTTTAILRDRHLHSVLVISQYFHVPRARLALERFGIPIVHSAHAHIFELRDLYSAPREFIGWIYYAFRRYPS
jgi:vancomycin permeability regulator SanA